MKYVTNNTNEFGNSMVMETFKDDNSQYGFYWKGDNGKWAISDSGTKCEVIRRLQSLIRICKDSIGICKAKGYKILEISEAKEIEIYRELIGVLESI